MMDADRQEPARPAVVHGWRVAGDGTRYRIREVVPSRTFTMTEPGGGEPFRALVIGSCLHDDGDCISCGEVRALATVLRLACRQTGRAAEILWEPGITRSRLHETITAAEGGAALPFDLVVLRVTIMGFTGGRYKQRVVDVASMLAALERSGVPHCVFTDDLHPITCPARSMSTKPWRDRVTLDPLTGRPVTDLDEQCAGHAAVPLISNLGEAARKRLEKRVVRFRTDGGTEIGPILQWGDFMRYEGRADWRRRYDEAVRVLALPAGERHAYFTAMWDGKEKYPPYHRRPTSVAESHISDPATREAYRPGDLESAQAEAVRMNVHRPTPPGDSITPAGCGPMPILYSGGGVKNPRRPWMQRTYAASWRIGFNCLWASLDRTEKDMRRTIHMDPADDRGGMWTYTRWTDGQDSFAEATDHAAVTLCTQQAEYRGAFTTRAVETMLSRAVVFVNAEIAGPGTAFEGLDGRAVIPPMRITRNVTFDGAYGMTRDDPYERNLLAVLTDRDVYADMMEAQWRAAVDVMRDAMEDRLPDGMARMVWEGIRTITEFTESNNRTLAGRGMLRTPYKPAGPVAAAE